MTDMVVYAEAERIVTALSDEQCDAVLAAIERRVDRWELEHRRPSTIARAHVAAPPARRPVGVLEAIRGVECCDPVVVRVWRRFRWNVVWYLLLCAPVVYRIVTVGRFWLLGVFGVACVMSLAVGFGMTRGKASVCH